ncbi:MAG: hypothetical protein AAFQ62_13340 [Pseudomonadota bacterium]
MRRVVAGILLTAAVAAATLTTIMTVRGPATEPLAPSGTATPSAPNQGVVPPRPSPSTQVSQDLVIEPSRNDARLRLALEATTDPPSKSTREPAQPYANLTLNEARDRIRQQRRDDVWAPRAEKRLEQSMARILGAAGDRTARIRCYDTDCVMDIYTATAYVENADLVFDVSVMLNNMDADFSLFSEGPTDQRLMVIVEFPEHYLRDGLTRFFPPLR